MDALLSLLSQLLLENPWPLGGVMILCGVVLWVSALNRREKKLAIIAGSLWVMAAVVFGLASAVTTQREQVFNHTRQLLDAATNPVDMATIRRLLSPNAELRGPHDELWVTFDELLPEVEGALTRWPVRRIVIRENTIDVTGNQAQVDLRISTRSRDDNFPAGTGSQWRLLWRRDASGQWQVETIRWFELLGQPPSEGMWR